MLERGSKIFCCLLDVRKAFDTVWIDDLLYELFHEFDIKGRMWLALKGVYTDITVQVSYDDSLTRAFDVLQGTGQGRTIAPIKFWRQACILSPLFGTELMPITPSLFQNLNNVNAGFSKMYFLYQTMLQAYSSWNYLA